MKKTITQRNKDLDLRRFGKNEYTKAIESGGEGGEDTGSTWYEKLLLPGQPKPIAWAFDDGDKNITQLITPENAHLVSLENPGLTWVAPIYETEPANREEDTTIVAFGSWDRDGYTTFKATYRPYAMTTGFVNVGLAVKYAFGNHAVVINSLLS